MASLFEKRAQGLYHNTAIVIDADGEIVGMYRKMHIQMILAITRNFILLGRSWVQGFPRDLEE